MKRTVIFGSSGFIGGALARLLIETKAEEDELFLVDRKFTIVGTEDKNVHRVSMNLHSQEATYIFLEREFDEAYQLAADSGNLSYLNSPAYEYGSSTVINLNILRQIDPRIKKFLYTSSSHATFPTDYGIEKRFNEILVTRSHIPTVVVRLSNVYGIWDSEPKDEKVLNAICRKIAEASNGDTLEFNDDNQIRSFEHVDTVVENLLVLEPSEEIIELKGSENATISELCGLVRAISGKQVEFETGFSITERMWTPVFVDKITEIYNHYVERIEHDKNNL
jgi:nucleoside-diphosphate-sugar epimerase